MNFSPQRISKFFLIVTIAILLFLTYLTFIRVQNLINYAALVDHTNLVRIELEQSLSYLKDAETGQRGFLLTKDSFFMEPYFGAYDKIEEKINILDSLTKNNPEQQSNILKFRRLNAERFVTMYKVLEDYMQTHTSKSQQKVLLLRGKMKMDEIRTLSRKMIDIEMKILRDLEYKKNTYASLTPRFIVLLMLFSLTLILTSYFIIIRELKNKIIAQDALEIKIDALNRSNSELEQFAYVASHDLQEPLRKIQAFGDRLVLKYKNTLDEDGNFIISRMQNAAYRMQLLINDLLTFSRLVDEEKANPEKTDLTEIFTNIRNDLQVLIDEKKAIIKTGPMPVIMAIPSQLQRLFQNLINNALKFSKKNDCPVISITYKLVNGSEIQNSKPSQSNQQFHKIEVIDNGIGFDMKYLEKIFIIFQRLHGKMDYSGSGIGLAVCKKIVVAHKGYLTAQSKEGGGSTFIVYLPVLTGKD